MAIETTADPLAGQTKKARQLLVSSSRHSYDPRLDIDWDAPLVEGKWFLPEKRCTLYSTPIWDTLTLEQKIVSSREEMASSIGLGVWTEHMLLHMVSRYIYDRNVATPQVQFALTEVADEVRHMIMFANVVEKMGSEVYLTPWRIRESGRLLKSVVPVAALWALILLTEEIFDQIQREVAADETVQPLVRTMSRIHVVEEARHISFARTELERFVPQLSKARLSALRTLLALSIQTFSQEFFNPLMYSRAGLPASARKEAVANPYVRETFSSAAERITTYYRSLGLIGGSSARIWRKAGFLKADSRD
ncbi:diiron oxygenase [Streptomyces sp. NBC_00859]|uniref:AurF N-oxygenase family protein n=1 Tax=Streptomyces sp. NBC_00859 TaxID=2903682 RepID=UPI003865D621|nr:diiron oxygenase [Streptomyces sp. NBC_00859]